MVQGASERRLGALLVVWQAHVSLYEENWELVNCLGEDSLCFRLHRLDSAYRQRYSVHDPASGGADRRHAQAMLADGNVERAVRWALDQRGRMESALFLRNGMLAGFILLALALEGGWTWLLERWQAAVESSGTESEWRATVAAGAIETGSLALVQEHWPHVQDKDRRTRDVSRAIGRTGSLEVFNWLADHGFIDNDPAVFNHGGEWRELMLTALMYGNVALVDGVLCRVPGAHQHLDRMNLDNAFYCSCKGGQIQTVEWLVSRGEVPDGRALGCAVGGGHLPIMRFLRERAGVTDNTHLEDQVIYLLSQSKPGCLSVLEYLVQQCQYLPTSNHVVSAATAANVRLDVLRFLATYPAQETWTHALADSNVCDDLDVQDLLHEAARIPRDWRDTCVGDGC